MKTITYSLLALTLFTSCAVSKTKLSDDGMKVKVSYTKPKKNCNAVKTVVGINEEGVLDLALNHARNLVAKEGANLLYVNDKVNNSKGWQVHATGYKCNK